MKKLIAIAVIGLISVSVFGQDAQNCEVARQKYLEANPDVKRDGKDAWKHYNESGKNEGRKWYPCTEEVKVVEVPKLPESVFQTDMTIVKNKKTNTLVITFKVSSAFNNADVESVKQYVQFFYSREGYIGWTPQVSHNGDIWTFVFNK
jgi:hypothetical protein